MSTVVGREVVAKFGSEILGSSGPLAAVAQKVRSESLGKTLARIQSSEKKPAAVGDSYSAEGNAD
jgi:hypothetical protein